MIISVANSKEMKFRALMTSLNVLFISFCPKQWGLIIKIYVSCRILLGMTNLVGTIVVMTVMKDLKKKLCKCLRVRKSVYISLLKPSNIPQLIVEVVKVVCIGLKRPYTLPQLIEEVVDIVQV